jgi:hypothetical protein
MQPFGMSALEPLQYSSTVSFEALMPGWRMRPATMVGLMQARSKLRVSAFIHAQAASSCRVLPMEYHMERSRSSAVSFQSASL